MNIDREKSMFVGGRPRPNDLVDDKIHQISLQFESQFREKLRPIRKIGKEAEFPVVTRDGHAADVSSILRALVDKHGFMPKYDADLLIDAMRDGLEIAVEVGRGTIEIGLPPCDDLWELQKQYADAMALMIEVAESVGAHLLGFGIQPRTRASMALMTPRAHYRALYRAIGAPWLALTTTAADQTHVDIARAELLNAINYMNLLSAPLIALCANSSIYAGRTGRFVSAREGKLKELGEMRYGMTPRKFESLEEFIRYLCDYKCFVLSERHNYNRFQLPFTNYLQSVTSGEARGLVAPRKNEISRSQSALPLNDIFAEFLWHEHYVWNSARARVKTSTIEVRPACQQPRDEPFAANALILGWVESLPQLGAYFRTSFADNAWNAMRVYRRAAAREGLKAREPAPNMLRDLVRIAEGGLARRGRGEEKFVIPIWERLKRKESPGMRARNIFLKKGMAGFLEELVIKKT